MSKRYVEISKDDALLGVVQVDLDGFTTVHIGWLKEILSDGGYTYEEAGAL